MLVGTSQSAACRELGSMHTWQNQIHPISLVFYNLIFLFPFSAFAKWRKGFTLLNSISFLLFYFFVITVRGTISIVTQHWNLKLISMADWIWRIRNEKNKHCVEFFFEKSYDLDHFFPFDVHHSNPTITPLWPLGSFLLLSCSPYTLLSDYSFINTKRIMKLSDR